MAPFFFPLYFPSMRLWLGLCGRWTEFSRSKGNCTAQLHNFCRQPAYTLVVLHRSFPPSFLLFFLFFSIISFFLAIFCRCCHAVMWAVKYCRRYSASGSPPPSRVFLFFCFTLSVVVLPPSSAFLCWSIFALGSFSWAFLLFRSCFHFLIVIILPLFSR